ncbi:hypothetical protein ScPMuIL_014551 [Solemya velum]
MFDEDADKNKDADETIETEEPNNGEEEREEEREEEENDDEVDGEDGDKPENENGDSEEEKWIALENGEASVDSFPNNSANGNNEGNDEASNDAENNENKENMEDLDDQNAGDSDETESMDGEQIPPMIVAGAESREAFDVMESPGSGRKKHPNMDMELLGAPFDHGWRREVVIRGVFDEYTKAGKPKKIPADVYYFTPEGTKLRSHIQISQYMVQTNESELSNDNFTFLKKPIFKPPGEIVRHANAARGRAQSKSRPQVVIERDSDGMISPLVTNSISKRIGRPPKSSSPRKGRPPGRRIGRIPKRYDDTSPETLPAYKPYTGEVRGRGRPPKRKVEDILSSPLPVEVPVKLETDSGGTEETVIKNFTTPPITDNSPAEPPVKKQKPTARKSTTQKSFTPSIQSPVYPDPLPVENLCGMNCPGLEGIAPTLHCGICMCLFHPKCVNHDVLCGISFTCLRCGPGKKPSKSASNGLMTVPAPGMLGSLLLMQNNANKIERKEDTPSPHFDLSKVKIEPGLENSSEIGKQTNVNGGLPRPETLGNLRTILDKRVDIVSKTMSSVVTSIPGGTATFSPLVIGSHGTVLQNVCLPHGPQMIQARTSAPQLPVGAMQLPTVNPILGGQAGMIQPHTGHLPPTTRIISVLPSRLPQPVTNVTVCNAPLSAITSPGSASISHLVSPPSVVGELGTPQTSLTPFKNGQLLTLPSAVTKRLNLQQPLALKINNMQIVVPPSCFLSTSEGLKVFLPPKTFPVQTGTTAQLSVTVSNNKPTDELGSVPNVITSVIGSPENNNKPSGEPKTTPKEKKKLIFKSGINHSSCFIKQLYGGFDCMLQIFQYLNICDLTRAGMVCKSWNRIARQQDLWRKVCLRDIAVTDWGKMVDFLSLLRPDTLDLKGLIHKDDRNRTWQKLVSSVDKLSTLKQMHFGLVPASVVQLICERMKHLQIFTAEWISDITDDKMWTTPTKIDIGKFGLLTNLRELRLRGVGGLSLPAFCINGGITELANLKNLELLSLTSLKSVQGTEFAFLTDMKNLRTLELGDCVSWTAETFEQLSKLTSLKCLRLECGGEIPDAGLGAALEPMRELEQLELIMFLIADTLSNSLVKLDNLKTLVLWPETTPHAALVNSNTMAVVSKLTQLKKLEWGIVGNKNNSIILDPSDDTSPSNKAITPNANEQVEWVPFMPESDNNDPRSPESLAEYIGVHQLKQRLNKFLPDKTLRSSVHKCYLPEMRLGVEWNDLIHMLCRPKSVSIALVNVDNPDNPCRQAGSEQPRTLVNLVECLES